MWRRPKCGREFKKVNQNHYCGEPVKMIDAYIDAQPESVWPLLQQVRAALSAALSARCLRLSLATGVSVRYPTIPSRESTV